MQEKLNKQALDYIAGLRQTAQKLWVLACNEAGIPPDSKFVVFSENNRAANLYNNAMQQLMEAESSYKAGGYVGLKIPDGRGRHLY